MTSPDNFSLDPISISTLKAEARALREAKVAEGEPVSHAAALEAVAHAHGYRDWNTARARLPQRFAAPAAIGDKVAGTYLKQAFTGTVIGLSVLPDLQHFKVTVQFDAPVDVVAFESFSLFRQRVTATLDVHGVSPARTGDGQPQMRLKRV